MPVALLDAGSINCKLLTFPPTTEPHAKSQAMPSESSFGTNRQQMRLY